MRTHKLPSRLTWCVTAAVLLALPACMTAEQQQAANNARVNRLVGLTMADFMAQTGLTPRDAYETAAGRVFVVEGAPRALAIPSVYGAPAVAADIICRMMLTTAETDKAGRADSWRITSINWRGGCADL